MKSPKWRLGILLAVLLGSQSCLVFGTGSDFQFQPTSESSLKTNTLPGENQIISARLVEVDPPPRESATVEVEYFYNGAAGPTVQLQLKTEPSSSPATQAMGLAEATPGRRKVNLRLTRGLVLSSREQRPNIDPEAFRSPLHTKSLKVSLLSTTNAVLAENQFEAAIDWPSSDPFVLSGNSAAEIDRLYKLCVNMIDSGDQFDMAKKGLEQIVLANPEYVPAYVELARYQMKTNWSTAGLAQAEQSLNTALRIDPNHANSLVLLGYVYAHQHRFKEAEEAFQKAKAIGTKNIWLYANWGELRAMEGKRDASIAMYRKAVDAPKDLETYERARRDAYEHLLVLLENEKQWEAADKLYQERIDRYPDNGCFKASHAAFRIYRRGDYESAIVIGNKALMQECRDDRINTRLILATAYDAKWAKEQTGVGDAHKVGQSFDLAQALYADMTMLMYSLASSQHTEFVIPALKQRGILIDTQDRNGVTALGYSILNHDVAAARALIRYGANVNQIFNAEGITPLMLAASRGDRDFVILLMKNGADRRCKTVSGYDAEHIAVASGFKDIANILSGHTGI